MLLDFAPLQLFQLMLFGIGFILVYGIFALLLNARFHSLRPLALNDRVFYGGAVLIGVVAILGFMTIDDARLRLGLLAASFVTLLIGIIDEKAPLGPWTQLLWQVVIATIAGMWGWGITVVSNPWNTSLPWADGGVIDVAWYVLGPVAVPGIFLTVAWLVFLMNAVNWLDGIDGLAGGVGTVALLTLAAVSLLPSVQDADTLGLALLGAGSVLGFLLWNFSPARVYLGTSGSWFLGLYIGMVAIVGGGKIVTTLLVLAVPVIDVVAVVVSRLWAGQRPWQGDTRRHLHYRLRSARLSPRVIASLGIAASALLGLAATILQTEQKIIAFVIAASMIGVVVAGIPWIRRSR